MVTWQAAEHRLVDSLRHVLQVSISTIGLYISYALPVLLRLTFTRREFVSGPFSLGIFSIPVGIAAVTWVAFVTVRSTGSDATLDRPGASEHDETESQGLRLSADQPPSPFYSWHKLGSSSEQWQCLLRER